MIRSIRESNSLQKGSMNNSIKELMVLRRLGVVSMPWKAPKIFLVYWELPNAGWIKLIHTRKLLVHQV